jgi:hypothetical protein
VPNLPDLFSCLATGSYDISKAYTFEILHFQGRAGEQSMMRLSISHPRRSKLYENLNSTMRALPQTSKRKGYKERTQAGVLRALTLGRRSWKMS